MTRQMMETFNEVWLNLLANRDHVLEAETIAALLPAAKGGSGDERQGPLIKSETSPQLSEANDPWRFARRLAAFAREYVFSLDRRAEAIRMATAQDWEQARTDLDRIVYVPSAAMAAQGFTCQNSYYRTFAYNLLTQVIVGFLPILLLWRRGGFGPALDEVLAGCNVFAERGLLQDLLAGDEELVRSAFARAFPNGRETLCAGWNK